MRNKTTISLGKGWHLLVILFLICSGLFAQHTPAVRLQDGQLVYFADSLGNRLVDFSHAGYRASNVPIPNVPVGVYVSHESGDQTERIQRAINYVATLPLGENGFRGTVLLAPGIFKIAGGLTIAHSGIVVRGSGVDQTTILGSGLDRTTLIRVAGSKDFEFSDKSPVSDAYVPVGSFSFTVANTSQYKVGEEILTTRPSIKEWIDLLGMKDFGGETDYIGWKPNERNITWNRTITKLSGNIVTVDVPLTTALDSKYGGGYIEKMVWPGRIQNVGIENIKLQSTYDQNNPRDEQHRWMAITMESVRNAWVRQVNFEFFAGSAVAVWNTGSQITVEDCKSLNPISEIGGQRRYTFYTEGQQCLFQRCYAEYGYHDFGVGFMAAGPNAFVECKSYLPYSFSGTMDSWASGVLFDIVNVDGQALRFSNRGMDAQGAGWTAANSMFWQCSASMVDCPAPAGAMNYAYAVWSQFAGNGDWHEANGFLKPRSLFYGQLTDRIGNSAMDRAHLLPMTTEASSSPTLEEAAQYVEEAKNSPIQLKDWIDLSGQRNPIPTEKGKAKPVDKIKPLKQLSEAPANSLVLSNGKLLFGDALATGNRQTVSWWRGNVRDYDAHKGGPHITRYVPGRRGVGHTDFIDQTVDALKSNNIAVLDHNYGLWYDRRRDDHERVRRMTPEAWAPFYELPFARSGVGTAWDGLSKYDLTSYNFWYWNRLREFVEVAEYNGLVLYHQNYFQHNILEAGGHYADFPWRTANNINNTPFPEPVNYAGDKRIFMAEQFYDVSDPKYRALHKAYIRQCLENFRGQSNVIQFTSAEYTGPLSFMEFWLDEIAAWEKETGEDVMLALSATKDVQDAILKDPIRAQVVDVVDIRYWWYGEAKDGSSELYAPEGGKNLAPRQHARLVKTPKETFESTYKAVKEYTSQYPNKAVVHNTHRSSAFGWAVFMAGGSLMNIPKVDHKNFATESSQMCPTESVELDYSLINQKTGDRIIYSEQRKVKLDLTDAKSQFKILWINQESGEVTQGGKVLAGGKIYEIEAETTVLWLSSQ
ncbi:MAG: DUF6298 domain-containing protein [Marinoscillum sp.]